MRSTSILVVDHLPGARLAFGGIMADIGCRVTMVENGYQAVREVMHQHFDIIFIDVRMPGINGIQTCQEIRKLDSKAAVIMMTADPPEELVKEAIDEGGYTVVPPPFEAERLAALISELLHGKALVLLADDRLSEYSGLKAVLGAKYRAVTARDAAGCLEAVESGRYEIIFFALPPGAGDIELVERIKLSHGKAAVIRLTDCPEEDMVKRALTGGCYACIRKTADMSKILALARKGESE